MKKFVYIFIYHLIWINLLGATNNGIEVRPGDKELIESEPEKIVTTVFRVTNTGSLSQNFIPEVQMPEGWKLITQDFPFVLDENQSDIRLVSFYIPQGTMTGKYPITYSVKGREYPSIMDFYTIEVHVLPLMDLSVQLFEAPKYVISGESYQVSFVVTNKSNVSDSVDIEVQSGENYPATLQAEDNFYGSLKVKKIVVTVSTPADNKVIFKHTVRLTAKLRQNDHVRSSAVSLVEIIPQTTGVSDPYHRLPVYFSLSNVTRWDAKNRSKFQGEITSEGTLDEEGKKHLQFCLRGPDIYNLSILAEHDQYVVGYWDKTVAFYLGDRTYSLSPLTEYARFGRGVEGSFYLNKFSFGLFYNKTRWIQPARQEMASFIRYNFGEKHRVGFNYLSKEMSDGNRYSDIVSFEGQFEPWKNNEVELEYALGKDDCTAIPAFWLKLSGHQQKMIYMLHMIRANPQFPGHYHDTRLLSANVSLFVINKLRINATMRQEEQNYNVDTTRYTAPYSTYHRLGLHYQWKKKTSVDFEGVDQTREDRLPTPQFKYREKFFRFQVGHRFSLFNCSASAEFGNTENQLLDKTFHMERYTTNLYFSPSSRFSLSGYMYYDDNTRSALDEKNRITIGFNMTWQIASKTQLFINFQSNYSQEEYYRDRNISEFRLLHTFPNRHQFVLQGRSTLIHNTLNQNEAAVMAKYQVPLGIPLCKNKSVGTVQGHVYDTETQGAIQNVILRINGSTAVSDKKGRFIFPSLKPGQYYLSVDKSRVGLNRVTVQKTPMDVKVRAGEEINIELGIVRGSSLFGRVMVFPADSAALPDKANGAIQDGENPYYVIGNESNKKNENENGQSDSMIRDKTQSSKNYGLPFVVVEMSKDSEVERRVTDQDGNFSFEEMRPGLWTVKVYDSNLPEYHYVEKPTFTVELKPGKEEEVLIRVLPRMRRIKILNEGEILIEGKKKEEKQDKVPKKNNPDTDKTFKEKYDLGLEQFRLKKYNLAVKIFQDLLFADSKNPLTENCQYWIGECYHGLGEYQKALEAFSKVLHLEESSYKFDDALMMSGLIYSKLGDRVKSREFFERLVTQFPNSEYAPKALHYLRVPLAVEADG